jgi:tetratricopeptide (TPR) repeat protein
MQGLHQEALAAYEEARERFTRLGELEVIAIIWHRTGIVHQEAGRPEAAEDAYRKSLALKVRLRDAGGQASTLHQLGCLYDEAFNRHEDAAAFYRQAADIYVELGDVRNEGISRSNLGETLRKLRRLNEARQETLRASACDEQFGHASEPWKTWLVLASIETDAGNPTLAQQAKQKAIACYLAYRRDGGENRYTDGRIALAVTQALRADDPATAVSLLDGIAADSEAVWLHLFVRVLKAVVAGSRDAALAETAGLDHTMAAEVLLLLERLGTPA